LLAVVDAFADAHIDDDLLDHRHLQAVLLAELFGELLAHHVFEIGLEPRGEALLRPPPLRGPGGLALARPVAPLWLWGRLRLLRLVALLGPRSLVRCLRLLALGFGFGVSHRSQLPNAWPPAPCVDCRPRPRI